MLTWIDVPDRKELRAKVIAGYVRSAGYPGIVCFSCGNASRALQSTGIPVVAVAPGGDLVAERWWTPAQIRSVWPHLFDATSGHLPMPLMAQLAERLRDRIGPLSEPCYRVLSGSGETAACLTLAYPGIRFVPVYDDAVAATTFEPLAPLARLFPRETGVFPTIRSDNASDGVENAA